MRAQQLLVKLGYNVGEPNGKMGARTANAIRLFQLQQGLKVTGEVSPELLAAMQSKAG
jgi:localization factor PodJL